MNSTASRGVVVSEVSEVKKYKVKQTTTENVCSASSLTHSLTRGTERERRGGGGRESDETRPSSVPCLGVIRSVRVVNQPTNQRWT